MEEQIALAQVSSVYTAKRLGVSVSKRQLGAEKRVREPGEKEALLQQLRIPLYSCPAPMDALTLRVL